MHWHAGNLAQQAGLAGHGQIKSTHKACQRQAWSHSFNPLPLPPTLLQVAYDFSRNKYFSTEEALEYGVIDNIVKPKRSALAGV